MYLWKRKINLKVWRGHLESNPRSSSLKETAEPLQQPNERQVERNANKGHFSMSDENYDWILKPTEKCLFAESRNWKMFFKVGGVERWTTNWNLIHPFSWEMSSSASLTSFGRCRSLIGQNWSMWDNCGNNKLWLGPNPMKIFNVFSFLEGYFQIFLKLHSVLRGHCHAPCKSQMLSGLPGLDFWGRRPEQA